MNGEQEIGVVPVQEGPNGIYKAAVMAVSRWIKTTDTLKLTGELIEGGMPLSEALKKFGLTTDDIAKGDLERLQLLEHRTKSDYELILPYMMDLLHKEIESFLRKDTYKYKYSYGKNDKFDLQAYIKNDLKKHFDSPYQYAPPIINVKRTQEWPQLYKMKDIKTKKAFQTLGEVDVEKLQNEIAGKIAAS